VRLGHRRPDRGPLNGPLSDAAAVGEALSKNKAVHCATPLVCLLTLTLIALGSCRKSSAGVFAGRAHPYGPDLMRPTSGLLHIDLAAATLREGTGVLRAMTNASIVAEIDQTRIGQQGVGEIEDLALSTDGEVYAVDGHFNVVRVFGRHGEPSATIGGPKELRRPLSVALDDTGEVYVGGMDRTVSVYTRGPAGYARRVVIPLPFAPIEMCFMGSELIVHGVDVESGQILHRYSKGGVRRASFGQVYSTRHQMIMHEISRGRIACFPSTGTIVYAPRELLPEVRAFSLDGRELWVTVLDGYKGVDLVEDGNGMASRIPVGAHNRIEQLVPLNTREALLQIALVANREQAASRNRASLRSIILTADTGTVRDAIGDLPEVGAVSLGGSEYVTVSRHPSTQITVLNVQKAESAR
jgi:hypothetical protein